MKFVCDRCQTKYSIADEKVRQKILKIRCKTCDNVITVREPAPEGAVAKPPSAGASGPSPSPSSVQRAVEWHLAVNGKEEGPFDLPTLARKVQAVVARNEGEAHIWKADFDAWKPAAAVPALQSELMKLSVGGRAPLPPPLPKPPARPSSAMAAVSDAVSRPQSGSAKPVGAQSGVQARVSLSPASLAAAKPAPKADESLGFDEDDRTQISPLDASLLREEVAKPAAEPAKPAFTNGHANGHAHVSLPSPLPQAPQSAFAALQADRRLSTSVPVTPAADLPAAAPVAAPQPAFFPQVGPASAAMKGGSQLSRLMGMPGFFSRHPRLKYVIGAAVLIGLTAAVVGVTFMRKDPPIDDTSGQAKAPEPSPAAIDEEKARAEARKRFGAEPEAPSEATVASAPHPAKAESRSKADRKAPAAKAAPTAPPPLAKAESVAPPPIGSSPSSGLGVEERRVVPTPAARTNDAPKPSAFSPSDFAAVIRKNMPTLKSCYDRGLRRDERLKAGKVEVQVRVGASGTVTRARCDAPPEFSTVSSCIEKAVKKMHFPVSGEEYEISIPLVMQGSG